MTWKEEEDDEEEEEERWMHDCQIIPFVSERSIIVINAMYKCLEGHFMQLQRGKKASN